MTHRLPSATVLRSGLAAGLAALMLTTCLPAGPASPPAALVTADAPAGEDTRTDRLQPVEVPADPGEGDVLGTAVEPLGAPPIPEPPAPAGPSDDAEPGALAPEAEPVGAAEAAVVPVQPRIRIFGGVPAAEAAEAARAVDGVSAAAGLTVGEVAVDGVDGEQTVQVAAVIPDDFRALTPSVTAQADPVWERLRDGDAAFTHDAGRRLEVELGERVDAAEGASLRIGAYASNGVPPVADAIVSEDTARELGLRGAASVLVALSDGVDPEVAAAALREATGLDVEVLDQPEAQRAFLTGAAAKDAFEPFTYIDNGDGMIQIDPDWVRRNIVRAPMPILRGEVVCHRLLIPQLRGALQEIQDRGLADLIDPSQYGGCHVPRHIDFNPSKPLSMHAWGLAADFNVSTNQLGAQPQMDPRIVEVFDRWGFVWGGRWRRPDGMHFELGAVLQPGEG